MFLDKYKLWPYRKFRDQFSFLTHQHIDYSVRKNIYEPVILISYCGLGLHSFRKNKKLGGINICDKGSTHIEYQDEIMREEFLRYGIKYQGIYQRRIDKEVREYQEADFITVPSKCVYDSFVKKGIPEKKLKMIRYGARISRFKPVDIGINNKKYTKKKDFEILFVGSFGIRKGAIDILEAFKSFDHPNKVLTIVGSISKNVKKLLKKYETENIKIMGTIRNDLLVNYYQKSDVLLLPSIEEGSAVVILEAMSSGCPVIVSNNAGADYINHGKNGFIVPIRSPNKICEYLHKISEDNSLKETLRNNSLKYISQINGWCEYGEEFNELIKSIN
jgi:glycosyltransferase involved in cell wall biosynthesis